MLAASKHGTSEKRALAPALLARSLREQDAVHTLHAGTDETTVYFAHKIADQTYVLTVTVDSRKAHAEVLEAKREALLIALMLGLLSAGVLGWLAHRHAARLRALQLEVETSVERVLHSSSSSEIESLTVSTRLMTARLIAYVDEMHRARDALLETDRRMRTLIDALPDEVRLIDIQGRYLMINRAARISMGLPEAKIADKTIYEL